MARLNETQMSSFLMYRIIDPLTNPTISENFPDRVPITNSVELEKHLENSVRKNAGKTTALALSGGIDSAILAKFMPAGSLAYTFKCMVPGMEVTDETPAAAKYAEECGLKHKIIEIYWEDYEEYAETLMRQKGAPVHSIEVQIYKAALQAKKDGIDTLIFGEAADAVYGGQSMILSKDWNVADFIERASYVMPHRALRNPALPSEGMTMWENDGIVDPYKYMSNIYIKESVGSYINATKAAGIKTVIPYAETYLATDLDYSRIRSGENKYLVREVFQRLYPDFQVPPKVPMPRPMNEWFRDWDGPKRAEFWPHCVADMTGDQKWLLWILEKYLDMEE